MRHFIPRAPLLCAVLLVPRMAAGQTVLDWPVALEARPDPLVAGAGAVLANPAGTADLDGRAEALVSDLETPDELGLRALTVAGAVRVLGGWSVAIAYRHVGVGDMLRTDGPPLGTGDLPVPTLEVAEDAYSLGVARRTGPFRLGLAGRVDTPADALGGDDTWSATMGVSWAPRLPFVGARAAATVELGAADPAFGAAAELESPAVLDARLRLGLGAGTRLESRLGAEHVVVATGTWRGVAELQAGATSQPGAHGSQWVPIFAGLLRLGRYRVGIVREHLPNGFGAAMHYRLSVAF